MKKINLIIIAITLLGCANQGYRTDYIISDPAECKEEKEVVCETAPKA